MAVKTKGAGVGVCVITGDLGIEGGPTNKGHFCRAQYAFRSLGAGAGADVPVLCEVTKAKLGLKRFSTDKPVSFSDFDGDAIFSSAGLEIGLGYTRSTMNAAGPPMAFQVTPMRPA